MHQKKAKNGKCAVLPRSAEPTWFAILVELIYMKGQLVERSCLGAALVTNLSFPSSAACNASKLHCKING